MTKRTDVVCQCDGCGGQAEGKLKALANGVPMPMGRAVAKAVRCAMGAI